MNTLRYFDFGAARPVLLLIARIAVVLIFIIFGFPKMMGFDGTVQYMASLGAPMPMLAAIIAVVMEVPAAILIVLGFFTPSNNKKFIIHGIFCQLSDNLFLNSEFKHTVIRYSKTKRIRIIYFKISIKIKSRKFLIFKFFDKFIKIFIFCHYILIASVLPCITTEQNAAQSVNRITNSEKIQL